MIIACFASSIKTFGQLVAVNMRWYAPQSTISSSPGSLCSGKRSELHACVDQPKWPILLLLIDKKNLQPPTVAASRSRIAMTLHANSNACLTTTREVLTQLASAYTSDADKMPTRWRLCLTAIYDVKFTDWRLIVDAFFSLVNNNIITRRILRCLRLSVANF